MAFLIREHILALLGDHTVSIEEALLESFYILLELYKNQSVTPELVEEYFSPEILLQLRTAITQAKSTISSLETWEECNELLQDLAVNYRKEGLYEKFLTPVITQAEYYSQIFGRQGIHVGEDMDATKGENEAGQLWDRWRQFRNAFASYEPLLRNFLRNEVFSDLILPENFETKPEEADNLEHMVLQMQWIAIAYAAIRQSLFLKWCLDADGISAEEALDYEQEIRKAKGLKADWSDKPGARPEAFNFFHTFLCSKLRQNFCAAECYSMKSSPYHKIPRCAMPQTT